MHTEQDDVGSATDDTNPAAVAAGMTNAAKDKPDDDDDQAHAEPKGKSRFTITYDDTGAQVVVDSPNGWTVRRVVAEGYTLLGEAPRAGDRIEANGTALDAVLDLRVKDFVDQGIAPDLELNIVSTTGGARGWTRDDPTLS